MFSSIRLTNSERSYVISVLVVVVYSGGSVISMLGGVVYSGGCVIWIPGRVI